LLHLLEQWSHEPDYSGGTTAAAFFHQLEHTPDITALLDEADNQGLFDDPKMRQIFNAGHEVDGSIRRFIGGLPRKYGVGAPLALAAIRELPRPLMSRAIIINLRRAPAQLKRFDETDRAFMITYEAIRKWAARCNLNRDPEMPANFHGRLADNWRPLFAIADDFGYGEAARAAAVVLNANRQYENPIITLLTDIRTVFDMFQVDRLRTKQDLIPALVGLEGGLWEAWTGLNDTDAPHTVTERDLGRLLRPFGITSKTLWPPGGGRQPGSQCSAGYYRRQFEEGWGGYCRPTATPPHPRNIKYLRQP
jgi:hypothetical protein